MKPTNWGDLPQGEAFPKIQLNLSNMSLKDLKNLVISADNATELAYQHLDLGNFAVITGGMRDVPEHSPQFSKATLKHLFWKRAEIPGLERGSRLIGQKLFINVLMFGLWMAGALPEQQGE